MELRTEIEIDATPAAVWQVLTDFRRYPEWNPFIVSIEGQLSPGGELRVALSPPESREYHILPQVVRCEPEQELRWRGQWGARFLFQGEHFFRLVALDGARTRFIHGEDFNGILVRWLGRQLTHVARGFVFMNQALKRRVESSAHSPVSVSRGADRAASP
jgi:hypothetical protein